MKRFRFLPIALVTILLAVFLGAASPSVSITSSGFLGMTIRVNVSVGTPVEAAITVTVLGTAQTKGGDLYINLTGGVSLGDVIIVAYAGDTAVSSGVGLHTVWRSGSLYDVSVQDVIASNTGNVITEIHRITVGGTKSWDGVYPFLVFDSVGDTDAMAITAYKVTGLNGSPLDKSNSGTGAGTDANTSATGTLSQADEVVIAASGVEDEIDDPHGTWSGVTGNEQFDATNAGGDTSNIQVHSVAQVVSATTSKTGIDAGHDSSDWAAAIATYKMAAGVAITVSPVGYDFGVVEPNLTYNTTTAYFTVTNTSSVTTNVSIGVTTNTWAGGAGWTHNDSGSPGATAAALKANAAGTWGTGDVTVKYAAPLGDIKTSLGASTNFTWGLSLATPTDAFPDGNQKTITVILTARAA